MSEIISNNNVTYLGKDKTVGQSDNNIVEEKNFNTVLRFMNVNPNILPDDNSYKLNNHEKNNSSIEESDREFMTKIDKEAERISEKIDRRELNIYNNKNENVNVYDVYDKMSEIELKKVIKEKNKEILSESKNQEAFKSELNILINKLNDAIDKSSNILFKREKNPQNIKSLEHIMSTREKEVKNCKNQIKIYQQQYEIIKAKSTERFSSEKINEMEEQIEKLTKENAEYSKKIRSLKNTQILQSKELELCNINKKYPQKIIEYTEEIRKLIAKKHDYFGKLNTNRKSIVNLKIFINRIYKNLNDILESSRNKDKEINTHHIEEELKKIKEELTGTEDEILEKIHRITPRINIIMQKIITGKVKPQKLILNKTKSPYSNGYLPKISRLKRVKQEFASSSPGYRGIFNKYEYLSNREKDREKNSGLNTSLKKKLDDNNSGSEEIFKDEEEIISLDYENTFESDYSKLIKKKEQLNTIKFKLDKNIKEVEKLFEKKFKDLSNSINHNKNKVRLIQQQNDLLSVEISDLTKIIKLNIEENKLKKEIKESESKIFKSLQQNPNYINNHNDVSETRNDILQELNNILIAEGERINKFKSNKNLSQNVIEEEHQEANSILENQVENENKNLKFPDISNVEHIEEDGDIKHIKDLNEINEQRNKNLLDIKNKYITLENEINNLEQI